MNPKNKLAEMPVRPLLYTMAVPLMLSLLIQSLYNIVDKNPDYIFAMDRDAAIGTDGAQLAQEILENELVKSTDAYKNGHVVYLAHPNVWYTAEGGIQALSEMLSDLENALL